MRVFFTRNSFLIFPIAWVWGFAYRGWRIFVLSSGSTELGILMQRKLLRSTKGTLPKKRTLCKYWILDNDIYDDFVCVCGGGVLISGLPWWLSSKESTCNAGDTVNVTSIPGSGRAPGEGNFNPRQYCLGNPMDRILAAYSPGVTKSQTRHSIHA